MDTGLAISLFSFLAAALGVLISYLAFAKKNKKDAEDKGENRGEDKENSHNRDELFINRGNSFYATDNNHAYDYRKNQARYPGGNAEIRIKNARNRV